MKPSSSGLNVYNILGVQSSASAEEIRQAYMRLIVKYHPDKNPSPDAANRFISIREAWSLLRDPQHRQLYDTAVSSSTLRDNICATANIVADEVSIAELSFSKETKILRKSCRCGGDFERKTFLAGTTLCSALIALRILLWAERYFLNLSLSSTEEGDISSECWARYHMFTYPRSQRSLHQ